MKTILFAILFVTVGCEGVFPEERVPVEKDPFFKMWVEPNSGQQLNLTGSRIGVSQATIVAGSSVCSCLISIAGPTDFGGKIEIAVCTLDGHTTHPNCTALNSRYEYKTVNGTLDLCKITIINGVDSVGNCETYY